jgi:hypothetical protein
MDVRSGKLWLLLPKTLPIFNDEARIKTQKNPDWIREATAQDPGFRNFENQLA